MATSRPQDARQTQMVASVARALTLASEAAIAHGIDPANSLVTIAEEGSSAGRIWRIHYGARDYISRRGGDLIVLVDEQRDLVRRVMRGK
jgi:hypothetical protein